MGLYKKFEKDLPNVAGKVFVITGTTSGTGFVAAKCVAKKGGEVVMLNRSSERADAKIFVLPFLVLNLFPSLVIFKIWHLCVQHVQQFKKSTIPFTV